MADSRPLSSRRLETVARHVVIGGQRLGPAASGSACACAALPAHRPPARGIAAAAAAGGGDLGLPTDHYHTYDELTAICHAMAHAHPDTCRLSSLGQSCAWGAR